MRKWRGREEWSRGSPHAYLLVTEGASRAEGISKAGAKGKGEEMEQSRRGKEPSQNALLLLEGWLPSGVPRKTQNRRRDVLINHKLTTSWVCSSASAR